MVEEVGTVYNPPYFVMRWYDNAPTEETAWSRPIVKHAAQSQGLSQ